MLFAVEEFISERAALVLAGVISSGLTLLLREGFPAFMKLIERKDKKEETEVIRKREDEEWQDERSRNSYEIVIANMKEQNDKLEAERKITICRLEANLDRVNTEHLACVKAQEGLKVTASMQADDIRELRAQVIELKARIDKSDARIKEQKRKELEDSVRATEGEVVEGFEGNDI